MTQRIVFVAEYRCDEKHWIERELDKIGTEYLFIDDKNYNSEDYKKKFGRLIYWRKYIKLSKDVIKNTRENDVIVALTFTLGLIISILCKVARKERKVIALNCIAYDNSKLDFVKIPLFRMVFLQNNLVSTVNAKEYIEKFDNKFDLQGKKVFHLLSDPYNERLLDNKNIIRNDINELYCFAGGEANRDWNMLINVANRNPNINFKITAREYMWNKNTIIPKNVEVKFDEPMDNFISKIINADIIIVPLLDDMVAGLTVFIQAIAMKKFVLVTDIPATRNYIPEDCRDILIEIKGEDELSKKINYYRNNIDEKNRIIDRLYNYLITNFSAECYVKRILEIVDLSF